MSGCRAEAVVNNLRWKITKIMSTYINLSVMLCFLQLFFHFNCVVCKNYGGILKYRTKNPKDMKWLFFHYFLLKILCGFFIEINKLVRKDVQFILIESSGEFLCVPRSGISHSWEMDQTRTDIFLSFIFQKWNEQIWNFPFE